MPYPLPQDVCKIQLSKIDSLSLLLTKYIPWQDLNGSKPLPIKDEERKTFLQGFNGLIQPSKALLDACSKRLDRQISDYQAMGYSISAVHRLKTEWRMVVGLGGENVLETSITLHWLYGFPYIPGSAVKGVTRAYAELELGEKHPDFRSVFGSESKNEYDAENNQLGEVIFFDAVPTSFPRLDVDIMNPHYPDYYQNGGSVPPGDWQNPVPITFLTVGPGSEFRFCLVSRHAESLRKAEAWMLGGLSSLGVGGKTSAGYGYFIIPEPKAPQDEHIQVEPTQSKQPIDPEQQSLNMLIQKLNAIPPHQLSGRIGEFIDRWNKLSPIPELAHRLARAIMDAVGELDNQNQKKMKEKPWYKKIAESIQ
jgi:CRISPR-associated protein Cmr6